MNTEILVIEDDDLVRQGIVDILELKGWNAVAARRERNHALQGDPQIYRQSHSFLISL